MNIENKHITEYLDFYLENGNAKNYAILIDGDWGAGKTHFIKTFFGESVRIEKHKFVYISLYGVSKASEIDDQIFQQLHPVLSNKYVSIFSKAAKSAIKLGLKIDFDEVVGKEASANISIPEISSKELLQSSSGAILIFDDLERCSIPVEKMLGFINYHCEHQDHRIIVVANEKEIKKSKKYNEIKEKLIGRTFSIKSNSTEAINQFINFVSNKGAKDFLILNKSLILNLYEASGYHNLRSLKQAMIEWSQIYENLPEKAKNHEGLLCEVLRGLLVLSFEIRKGFLNIEDLGSLSKIGYSYALDSQKGKKNHYAEIEKKYTSFFFNELCPDYFCWYCFFKEGAVPRDTLANSINNSKYFKGENTPDWLKLLYFSDLEESDFQILVNQVWKNFEAGKYTKQGEIKHVVGTYLFFSEHGMIPKKENIIASSAKKIIQKLIKDKALIYESKKNFEFNDAYAGVIFISLKNKYFQGIVNFLADQNKINVEIDYPKQADELLDLVEKDSETFWNSLSNRAGTSQRYYNIPIFKHSDPNKFLQAFIKCPNANKIFLSYAFKDRYQFVPTDSLLIEELSWLKSVKNIFVSKLKSADPTTLYHIKRFIDNALSPAIVTLTDVVKKKNSTTM